MFGRMSGRENVVGGYPVREVSVGEVSGRESVRRGTIPRGSFSLSSIHKEVSVGELPRYQWNFLRGTAMVSSKKEQ